MGEGKRALLARCKMEAWLPTPWGKPCKSVTPQQIDNLDLWLWLQGGHMEDAGPFRSATHTAPQLSARGLVLYCWQMNLGPASVPMYPDVGQNPLVRAWRAQCVHRYGNNHHEKPDLSLWDNLTKECHYHFTDGKTEARAGRQPPQRH